MGKPLFILGVDVVLALSLMLVEAAGGEKLKVFLSWLVLRVP